MTTRKDVDKEWEKLQALISQLNSAASQSPGDQRIRMSMLANTRPTSMDLEQKRKDDKIKAEMEAVKHSRKKEGEK